VLRTLLRDSLGKLAASGPSYLLAALALGLQVRIEQGRRLSLSTRHQVAVKVEGDLDRSVAVV
jgi:hypothetical protein